MTKVITRFPPSPTGFLHIGGARTALFNWLYAKANQGSMLLRIEDTDRERSTDEAIEAIIKGLEWLQLDYDNEPQSQFANRHRHVEIAEELLEEGKAYRCYASPEELQEMRDKARTEGKPIRYDGRWRDKSPADAPQGVDPVIRIKAPLEGITRIDDLVQGTVDVPNDTLDDMIILRSDGTPTYMLAVVVDDHDMGVTHIIRGDDHLTNTARQMVIYHAMSWDIPAMAHIPLIHGSDGAKMSKRHGALGVDQYRKMGFLPEAVLNYLVRLGWSHGDEEIFSIDEMIRHFDLDHVNKAASRFDMAKLENLNAHYIKEKEERNLLDDMISLMPETEKGQMRLDLLNTKKSDHEQLLLQALPFLKPRAKTILDLIEQSVFLYAFDTVEKNDAAKQWLQEEHITLLGLICSQLQDLASWDKDTLTQLVKTFCADHDIKMPQIAKPLRVALTGSEDSIGIYEILLLLGQNETIHRLKSNL